MTKQTTPVAETTPSVCVPDSETVFPHNSNLVKAGLKHCGNNETGDADVFVGLNRDKYVFDLAENRWYTWNGHHWTFDRLDSVFKSVDCLASYYAGAIREINTAYTTALVNDNKTASDELKKQRESLEKRIYELHSRKRRENILHAVARRGLGITGDEWDSNPMLLGTPAGVIDLKTGLWRAGKPEDYIKTVVNIPKNSPWWGNPHDVPCPLWTRTLLEIFDNDAEMVGYIQRLFGYGITGLRNEHVFPLLVGRGRNGKSTILETLKTLLGDLAHAASAQTMLDSGKMTRGMADPDTYALRGKRLVWASETSDGACLSTDRIKRVTGGDTLIARQLYGKPVEFKPTHLAMLLTNDKPKVPAHDYAIWGRLHLIPFEFSFVNRKPEHIWERKADKHLPEKLESEMYGILAWLVAGCLKWQTEGLNPPEKIKSATREYQQESDTIGVFLRNCENIVIAENASVKAGELHAVYKLWCESQNEEPLKIVKFGREMKKRFETKTANPYVTYAGIGLLAENGK